MASFQNIWLSPGKIKRRRPFAVIALSYGSGILLSWFVTVSCVQLGLIISCLFLTAVLSWDRQKTFAVSTALLFVALGWFSVMDRTLQGEGHVSGIARYYRFKPIELKGVIVSDVQERDFFNGRKTTFTLAVEEVRSPWGWRAKKGKLLVNIFRPTDMAYGDLVHLVGRLHRPYNFSTEGKFSYEQYLNHRGVYHILSVKKEGRAVVLAGNQGHAWREVSLKVRHRLQNILQAHLTPNEAGIMQAVLLGERSGIPKHIRTLFAQTGTAHILAISGLHVGIIVGLVLMLLRILPFSRRLQLMLAMMFLIAYAFMTGGRPSVVRATVMAVVFLTSFVIEREADAFNTLALAGLLILLVNPLNLFDVGFQLSFLCVFAIIYISPLLNGRMLSGRNFFTKFICDSLCVSAAVWVAVAGLIAHSFGIITPVTVLANVLVVPALAVIVALGFGLLIAGTAFPMVSSFFAACLKLCLNAMVGVIFLVDKLPFAYFYIKDINAWSITCYYATIGIMITVPWTKLYHNLLGNHRFQKRFLNSPGND